MKPKILVLVLGLQTAWLLGTVILQEHSLASGKTILLETRRVDPRDLLRGDYFILNYDISDVPVGVFAPPVKTNLPAGTKVFVALVPGTNQFYVVARASTNEPSPSGNEVLLQGRCDYFWWRGTNTVHVVYGIEKYFVAEGTGNPRGKLTVQAVVPSSGRARIKQVFVDGKPYTEVMKPDAD